MHLRGFRLRLLAVVIAALMVVLIEDAKGTPSFSLLNQSMPEFSLTDQAGRTVSRRSLAGRVTVLLVFCSCEACQRVGSEWARQQHLPSFHPTAEGLASTLVVYAGDPAATRDFARVIDFDRASTVIASDPSMSVAQRLRALPCPAVYVVDAAGFIRYSSKELAPPNETSPSVLIGQTLNLLTALGGPGLLSRAVEAGPIMAPIEVGPSLTPVVETDLQRIEENGLLWQAGNVPGPRISREFRFRNTEKVPIEISQVQASCGCGAVTLSKNGKVVTATVARPGETVKLLVTAEIGDAPISKVVTAWLYSKALTPIGFVKITIEKTQSPR